MTHTSNSDKTTASALLNLAEDADLVLDVTVVIQNSNGVSQYGYAGYQLTNGAAAAVTYVPNVGDCVASVKARCHEQVNHLPKAPRRRVGQVASLSSSCTLFNP